MYCNLPFFSYLPSPNSVICRLTSLSPLSFSSFVSRLSYLVSRLSSLSSLLLPPPPSLSLSLSLSFSLSQFLHHPSLFLCVCIHVYISLYQSIYTTILSSDHLGKRITRIYIYYTYIMVNTCLTVQTKA